jgi:hypothetical protein
MSLSTSNSSAFEPFERKNQRIVFTDYEDTLLPTTGITATETIVTTRKSRRNAFNKIREMFKFSTFGTKTPIFPK